MSTVLENKPASRGGVVDKLAFFNGLQSVTNTIHSTTHLDEIILDLGWDICSLFGADRLTIYVACDGGKSIGTKVKTGLNSYKDFKLPVTDQSVAGYVALHKRTEAELKALLDEYSLELAATEAWKRNPEFAREALYKDWLREFGDEKGDVTLYTAAGCEMCNSTGYKGRVGLHELLVGTDAIKKNIQEHARVADMFATAVGGGNLTLKQDGIEKVLMGVTDIQQVRSVCIK